ncbi:MAG: hypothetical protein R6T96_01380, partial [Longimicrobiales bacterium]
MGMKFPADEFIRLGHGNGLLDPGQIPEQRLVHYPFVSQDANGDPFSTGDGLGGIPLIFYRPDDRID